MKMESAAAAKGIPQSHKGNLLPAEGTRLRRTYDLLMANKGIPIEEHLTRFGGADGNGQEIEQLRNFYGLDIRRLAYGRWVLAGEWFGRVYHDYIADRINEGRA